MLGTGHAEVVLEGATRERRSGAPDIRSFEALAAAPDLGDVGPAGRPAVWAGSVLLVLAVVVGAAVEGGAVSLSGLASAVRDVALGFAAVAGTVYVLARPDDRV